MEPGERLAATSEDCLCRANRAAGSNCYSNSASHHPCGDGYARAANCHNCTRAKCHADGYASAPCDGDASGYATAGTN